MRRHQAAKKVVGADPGRHSSFLCVGRARSRPSSPASSGGALRKCTKISSEGGGRRSRSPQLSGGMFANDAEKAAAGPDDETWCDCGCGDMEDLSDDDDEVADLTETPGQKRAREDDEKLANFTQQVDCIIASKAAMAAASKGAAGGAARVLER